MRTKVTPVLCLLWSPTWAWSPGIGAVVSKRTWRVFRSSEFPSDVELPAEAGAIDAEIVRPVQEVKTELLRLAALTARGETATNAEKDEGRSLVRQLESKNPTSAPALAVSGTWELVFSVSTCRACSATRGPVFHE